MHAPTPAAQHDPSTIADVRSRAGTTVAGRYRMIRMIGEGGMGAVFEAEILGSGERVAVKVIKPEYATSAEVMGRFFQEVRAVGAVGHPNIVRLLDAGTDAFGPFMVLELLKGETLCDVLDRRPLGPREALGVMSATLDALQAAHHAGVVHRDIKPENIFLVGGAERCTGVKLLDFGISKIISMQSASGGITRVGTAVGTPDYMSPEQAGGGRVDGRADLWSVGAVLYEALTLEHPFEGESYQQLISNIVLHPHTPLRRRMPTATAALEGFIDRALRKEPADRFSTASEMLQEAQLLLRVLPPDPPSAWRVDEPTSVVRAAPNEPTQVIEVRSSVARPERSAQPASRPPSQPPASRPPPSQPPPSAPRASAPVPSRPPPAMESAWATQPEAPTLTQAPAMRPSLPPPPVLAAPDERNPIRTATVALAVVAGVLVAGALALRIRAVTRAPDLSAAPTVAAPPVAAPAALSAPVPTAQVLAPAPTAQVLAPTPTAQVLAPTPTAQVLAPTPAPMPAPAARAAPAPRPAHRPTTPLPPPPSTAGADARMTVLRAALPSLRTCADGPPPYAGNVDAMVMFNPRGAVSSVQLRQPSRVTVYGSCIERALRRLSVPSAAGSAVPLFHTFR